MKTPAYMKPAIFVIFILLLLTGTVTFGAERQRSDGYLAIPGVFEAPASFMPHLINDFPVLEHAQAWLHGQKRSLIPFIDDVSTLLPGIPGIMEKSLI
jgi:hypothetical protein